MVTLYRINSLYEVIAAEFDRKTQCFAFRADGRKVALRGVDVWHDSKDRALAERVAHLNASVATAERILARAEENRDRFIKKHALEFKEPE